MNEVPLFDASASSKTHFVQKVGPQPTRVPLFDEVELGFIGCWGAFCIKCMDWVRRTTWKTGGYNIFPQPI